MCRWVSSDFSASRVPARTCFLVLGFRVTHFLRVWFSGGGGGLGERREQGEDFRLEKSLKRRLLKYYRSFFRTYKKNPSFLLKQKAAEESEFKKFFFKPILTVKKNLFLRILCFWINAEINLPFVNITARKNWKKKIFHVEKIIEKI